MIRKTFKNLSANEKLKTFIQKNRVPIEYLSANRKMVSKAVFIGLFIAFIPMPMQMLAVVAFIPFTRFNVPIALAMCWLSNPFTMPAMYYMEYMTGSFFLGMETTAVELSVDWFAQNIGNIFIPLYVGTAFYSIVGSSVGYYLVTHLWRSSVKKDQTSRKNGTYKRETSNKESSDKVDESKS
ncbi:DUF2062 domain-containing protein [Sulfurimonas sp.]|jgi:hypothetical protein|uniref:DUF2062 domain-containing protein n=1 Tax=Sulfurimonas sp. TaxID=2022749 RepID=UPI0025EEED00|nr:DUF2062 domain-containing protein [Sulfurimonas sp.]MCK9473610.1 DUF2062 domain-containing protein [Sulfurimonas sp.]MDD3505459.1 DUF2062 domain-containing protein [Sulfurimonas sp.]